MSLTFGAILLGFVVVTIPLFARQRDPHWELTGGMTAFVLLFARGPEPNQTYLLLTACAVGLLPFALSLKSVPRQVLTQVRTELVLLFGLIVALLLSAFVVPDRAVAQMPLLAVILGLGAALIITGCVRVTILFVRALRQRAKSA